MEQPNRQIIAVILIGVLAFSCGAPTTDEDSSDRLVTSHYVIENSCASANLSGLNLRGIDFSRASLRGAIMFSTDLSNAKLFDTDLYGATLSGANLSGADLRGATLVGAQLDGVNFAGANLLAANMSGANLSGARGLTPRQRADAKAYGAVLDP